MEYSSALKKNETLPFSRMRMDLEGIMFSAISQIEKDRFLIKSLTCGL